MNLFNGVFSKSSAFTKIKASDASDDFRIGRSMDGSNALASSSSNPSVEDRRSWVLSSERHSSSSDREMSMGSEKGGSLNRYDENA
mmetsp:Transcript_23967/g.27602  ORF Transcript_23967/g.27602 Transcript_23967/m.27602 type:complete len:86 (+) Transcript_23967:56-313(+)